MLAAFVPIWLLTGLGWVTGRRGLLGGAAERVLGGFVFHLAMPAALFTALSRTELDVRLPALGAFAASTAATMALAFVLCAVARRRGGGEATIGAMAAGYVNSANLGIPVALQVLGDATFLTGVLLFQVLVVTPVVLVLLDRSAGRAWRPGRLLTLPLRNPVIAGPALGALCAALHWRPPDLIGAPLAMLGAAAVPTALVTLGLSLTAGSRAAGPPTGDRPAPHVGPPTGDRPVPHAGPPTDDRPVPHAGPPAGHRLASHAAPATGDRPAPRAGPPPVGTGPHADGVQASGGVLAIRALPTVDGAAGSPDSEVTDGAPPTGDGSRGGGVKVEVALLSGLKLLVQPVIAWSVGRLVGVTGTDLLALVVCAALPTAQNTYIFAREYGRAEVVARETVVVTTACAMGTLALIGALLG
ncbi:AEC family transporter [Micromonospora sp. CPCC 206171]|uniref:AEC family transporter n=2 Tax=unclassified Micromonospora TaxID=2617518 RepID=UPI002FEE7F4B